MPCQKNRALFLKVGPLRRDLFDRYGMFETCSIAKMQVRKGEIFKNRYGGRDYSKRHRWSGSRKWTGSFHIYIYHFNRPWCWRIVFVQEICIQRSIYLKTVSLFESTLWYTHFFYRSHCKNGQHGHGSIWFALHQNWLFDAQIDQLFVGPLFPWLLWPSFDPQQLANCNKPITLDKP